MRALSFVLLVVGCGQDAPRPKILLPDAGRSAYPEGTPCGEISSALAGICNPLTQTGCNKGCKCGWIQVTSTTGHVGCNPIGPAATGQVCNLAYSGGDSCGSGDICITARVARSAITSTPSPALQG